MKKITALIMLTVLLFSLTGCQGESESGDESGVALPNGYHWGMPMDEVLALAEEEGLHVQNIINADAHLAFPQLPFGPFTSLNMDAIFENPFDENDEYTGLYWIRYASEGFSQAQPEKCVSLFHEMKDYLTGVYGEPTEADNEKQTAWIIADTTIDLRITTYTSRPHMYCILVFIPTVYASQLLNPGESDVSASAAEPFTLRNGYTWGMTVEEVSKLAEDEGLALARSEPGYLQYSDVPVGGYPAKMTLTFHQKPDGVPALIRINYAFNPLNGGDNDPGDAAMFAALLDGLKGAYGDPSQNGGNLSLMSTIWLLPDTEITFDSYGNWASDYYSINYLNKTTTPAETKISVPNSGF